MQPISVTRGPGLVYLFDLREKVNSFIFIFIHSESAHAQALASYIVT